MYRVNYKDWTYGMHEKIYKYLQKKKNPSSDQGMKLDLRRRRLFLKEKKNIYIY